jgi:hypothetical protein
MFLRRATGGIGGFQELNPRDRDYLKSEAGRVGLRVYIYGTNGIVWAPRVLTCNRITPRRIMVGGNVGADGVATARRGDDDRRVGPHRYCLYGDFSPVSVPSWDFEFDNLHAMARTFTAHRWRLPLYLRSIRNAAEGVRLGDGLMVGDFNDPRYRDLPGVPDRAVVTPVTFGRNARYDQAREWGRVNVVDGSVRVERTGSDHLLLYGEVDLMTSEKPSPPPVRLPRPGDSRVAWRKHGAPVRHPWAKRSARWVRRNRKTWARILRWRKAYLRRWEGRT